MAKTPFYYFPIGSLVGVLIAAWLSVVFASLASLRIVIDLLRSGKQFFVVKDRTGKNRPKVLDKYGSHRFVQLKKQNIKLHYVESGNQDRQLMLFVHGFPECWFSWRHQIEAFSANYRTIAVSMRGYGDSDKPEGAHNYSSDKLVFDLIEFIETLNSKRKIILVAHDWGGVLAWTVAILRPDLVERFIVLNAPHPKCWNARIETTWKQFFSSWYMFFFNFPLLAELYFRANDFKTFDRLFGQYGTSEETEVYKHYFAQPYGTSGPLNYYRASLRGYGIGNARESSLDKQKVVPKTIIIWGRDDVALVPELAQDSAQQCKDATVEYVDNCSHWIQIDRPKEVNEIMRKFLQTK